MLTILENERLSRRQLDAMDRLELANQRIEEQAGMISKRNEELEMGVLHLKDVLARLANGHRKARARLNSGELLPLAASLNLLAERFTQLEQSDEYGRRLRMSLEELSIAFERYKNGGQLVIPPSCVDFPEINHLLYNIGMKGRAVAMPNTSGPIREGQSGLHQPYRPALQSMQQVRPQPVNQPPSSPQQTDRIHRGE